MTYRMPTDASWSAVCQANMLPVDRVPMGLSSSANSWFSSRFSCCSSSRMSASGEHASSIKAGSRKERSM